MFRPLVTVEPAAKTTSCSNWASVKAPLSAGVLVYATALQDSVLYVLISDSADDANIALRDKLTGVRLNLQLPAQHAALALIGVKEKAVITKYGF